MHPAGRNSAKVVSRTFQSAIAECALKKGEGERDLSHKSYQPFCFVPFLFSLLMYFSALCWVRKRRAKSEFLCHFYQVQQCSAWWHRSPQLPRNGILVHSAGSHQFQFSHRCLCALSMCRCGLWWAVISFLTLVVLKHHVAYDMKQITYEIQQAA